MENKSKYLEILAYRDAEINKACASMNRLNLLHDQIMKQTLNVALDTVTQNLGPPPSPFCFFIMGSAGRCEQGVWSDQDHGIIFTEGSEETLAYFLKLGEEISEGLFLTGYKKCEGNVMASNPFWCKSISDWRNQVKSWVLDASWKSIRHLLTFMDGRSLTGDSTLLNTLKKETLAFIHQEHLFPRFLENTMHVKKSVGVLGQLLVETHGPYTGLLNIKESGLFPYVNGARLLAIQNKLLDTSTILRLKQSKKSGLTAGKREKYAEQFAKLHHYRLSYGVHTDYESGHFLAINQLSKQQKKELKEILKDGVQLFNLVKTMVKKEDANVDE